MNSIIETSSGIFKPRKTEKKITLISFPINVKTIPKIERKQFSNKLDLRNFI
jgi:hypothetical protein